MLKIYLPPKRKRIYKYLQSFIGVHGYSPTQEQMAGALKMSRSLVSWHLGIMKDQKLIRQKLHSKRGIKLVTQS